MTYTVDQLSKLAGVSIRTLHYYDEIGLLKPSFVRPNGYRVYEQKELFKLQQILFFRELEFPLEQIVNIINAPNFDVKRALADQKKLLQLKKERIENLLNSVDDRLQAGKNNMDDTQLFGSFTKKQMDEYKEEAKSRWGNTNAYKQSQERTKHWKKEDYKRVEEEGKAITSELARLMDRGIEDIEVQKLIAKHYAYIGQFYDCSYDMYRGLGVMYVEDPRFTQSYDKFRPGLAVFVRDAIVYYCDKHA